MQKTILRMLPCLAVVLAVAAPAAARDGYRTPPAPLAAVVDAPDVPQGRPSPDGTAILFTERPRLPSIAELARPELRLAGLRIDPASNGSSRDRGFTRLFVVTVVGGASVEITGWPDGTRVGDVEWAPDSRHVAFSVVGEDAETLWVADVASGKARRLLDARLNGVLYGAAFAWLPDSSALVCRTVPGDRGALPAAPAVPVAPVIQENLGSTAPARTYRDLLANPHDADVFEYFATSQLVLAGLDGSARALGSPGMHLTPEPAPGGALLLVTTFHRPFSYLVPVYRFPRRIEVWDRAGAVVHRLVDLPLAEEVPIAFDAVPTGPRAVAWRQDVPATLVWAEAADGGDPRVAAAVRDRVLMLAAPFEGEPETLARLSLRYRGVLWGDSVAVVTERWRKDRRERVWLVEPGAGAQPRLLFDLSSEDRYADPGSFLTHVTSSGARLLTGVDGGAVLFLSGKGASEIGDRPFLDRYLVSSGTTERLWRSQGDVYEEPVAVVSTAPLRVITRRESVTEPPNWFVRDLAAGAETRLTSFANPTPQLAGASKELIRYTRDDGVALTATLYLPAGWTPEEGPLRTLVWAYPREFKSADAASQVRSSPYRFVRVSPRSPLPFLAMGYAVLDDPAMPIVGEGDTEPNDTYVEQLVASAKAAVDEIVRRGVTRPGMIAIGGHSYGAFMTANLLAHSDLFAAGIARSGAYNRTLTPFGFQAEERTLWQAPEIYFAMSPFMHADTVNEPILLVHGMADNNSGTFPMQSERFYEALKGLGGTARLVMLPHESHGYVARESLLHMLWEMNRWLDLWLAKPQRPGA